MNKCNLENNKKCPNFKADKKEPEFCCFWDIAGDWDKTHYTGIESVCNKSSAAALTLEELEDERLCKCGRPLGTNHKARESCKICQYEKQIEYKRKYLEKIRNRKLT
jgi:hypothetical protein